MCAKKKARKTKKSGSRRKNKIKSLGHETKWKNGGAYGHQQPLLVLHKFQQEEHGKCRPKRLSFHTMLHGVKYVYIPPLRLIH
jgi:hypothetical protein